MSLLHRLFEDAKKADSENFLSLINRCIAILREEPREGKLDIYGRLVRMQPKGEVIVLGDLHGDLESFMKILEKSRFFEKVESEDLYIVFLGDYGDRGAYSPEVYYVTLRLKEMFPERVILLRGNHEGPKDLLAYPHDLPIYLRRKYGSAFNTIYNSLTELFEALYLSIIVDERLVMLHGGVPSRAVKIEDLAFALKKHPAETHLEEILWSDPVENLMGVAPSPRGAGKLFGRDVTEKFLKLLNVNVLIRGHEPVNEGFKINHEGKILTLFSRKGAPYYNQSGAYLQIDLSEEIRDGWQLLDYIVKI